MLSRGNKRSISRSRSEALESEERAKHSRLTAGGSQSPLRPLSQNNVASVSPKRCSRTERVNYRELDEDLITQGKKSQKAARGTLSTVSSVLGDIEDRNRNVKNTYKPNATTSTTVQPTERSPSRSGIIKSLSLFNFMCHESFHQEWHPNLNYIIGENGSGKSALLSGLLIALGGKAAVTSRTKSVNSLVKSGEQFAKTKVTLINNGSLNTEIYGDQVEIERILDVKGSSKYYITALDKRRSLKHQELEKIISDLRIEIENPVSILNQEVARSFLRSKDPREKYKFFYEGSLLLKCERLLDESTSFVDSSRDVVHRVQERFDSSFQHFKEVRKQYKEVQQIQAVQETLSKLKKEYAWALVIEVEKEKFSLETKIEKCQKECDRLSLKIQNAVTEMEDYRDSRTNDKIKVALQDELSSKRNQDESYRKELNELRNKIKIKENCVSNYAESKQRLETRFHDATRELEKAKERQRQNDDNARQQHQEKLRELEESQKTAAEKYNSRRHDVDQFRHALDKVSAEISELQIQKSGVQREIDDKKRELNALTKTSVDSKFSVYGEAIVQLLNKIKVNQHQFKKTPIGPLGAYFTVKDKKWIDLVEFVMGPRRLLTFLVDNAEDSLVLRNLWKTIFRDETRAPSVTVMKFRNEMHDASRLKVDVPGIPTLLDLIEVENNDPVVFNAILEIFNPEVILMFPSDEHGFPVMGKQNGCPVNCHVGYSLNFYKFTPLHKGYSYMAQRQTRSLFLRCSKENETVVASRKLEITELAKKLDSLSTQFLSKKKEESKCREEYNVRQSKLNDLKKDEMKINTELRAHKDKAYRPPDIASYMEDYNESKDRYEQAVNKLASATQSLEDLKPTLEDIQNQRNAIAAELLNVESRLASANDNLDRHKEKLQKMQSNIEKFRKSHSESYQAKNKLDENVERLEARRLQKIALAEEIQQDRIDTQNSSDNIQRKIQTLTLQIESSKNITVRIEALQNQLLELEKKLHRNTGILNSLKETQSLIENHLKAQKQHFETSKRFVSKEVSDQFYALLTSRGYTGQLVIDDDKKELYYFICPDKDSGGFTQTLQRNNPGALKNSLIDYSLGLSGGERSFATICYIIAMWQVMPCPFFMLDEFDVFMDSRNRQTSQLALQQYAKIDYTRQYFIYSPLDLIVVPEQDDAVILRLKPPARKVNSTSSPSSEAENIVDSGSRQPRPTASRSKRPRRN